KFEVASTVNSLALGRDRRWCTLDTRFLPAIAFPTGGVPGDGRRRLRRASAGKERERGDLVRRLCVGVVVASLFALLASACGDDDPSHAVTEKDFPKMKWSHSATVDNTWLPLVPGTQLTYEGRANRGTGILPHRIVSTVTDLTKVIGGIRAVVIWERDFNEGQMVESELAFQAQDNDGNVWNLGEYPEVYEQGKLVGAEDTWLQGVHRAKAGVLMRAKPQVGAPSYLQGWAPEIEFRDRA